MGRCMNCLNACVQIVRWLPVVIVAAALSWGYYAYVYELCIKTVENNVQRALYLLFFHIFLGLFLASYYQTIFAPIRKPPDAFYPPDDILEELESCKEDPKMCSAVLQRYADHNQLQLMTRGYDGGIRFCFKCKCVKPDRSHHCSMCGQCVLKFDHHCPWVNTCVNFHNYKFFLLFLGWGFVFCVYIMLTDMPYFIDFWVGFGGNMKAARFHLLFMVFVSGMFALSLSCLFFYHLWLTAKNRSTVEGFRAPLLEGGQYDKNAFNHGIRANYREVFGPNWRLWILPVYSSCGSGSRFRVRGVDAMSYHQADAAVAPTASLVAPNASAQPPPSPSASSLPHSDPTHCCSSARVSASETV